MADPNHIVFDKYGLAFIQPCKTANLSQKAAIARALGKPLKRLSSPHYDWEYRYARDIPGEYLIVGTVRHPLDRLVSAWTDRCRHFDHDGLETCGFRKDMDFEQAARHVCQTPDDVINDHFRSLHYEYGDVEPDILVRFETLRQDWERTRFAVQRHCGLQLARLEQRNVTKHDHWSEYYSQDLEAAVRQRYADDFRRWYAN